MADFRRWILALTVLALCVGGAFAQVGTPTGGVSGLPFTCTAQNGAVTPTIRQEGVTDMVGDILITCNGGTPLAAGAVISTVNITVFMNTQVTSRLLGAGGVSEAVLFIDEPNTGLTGIGPSTPVVVCANVLTGGCPAVAGPLGNAINPGSITVGTPNGTAAPNAYQGVVDPVNSKYVAFYGVPLMPPATSGVSRVFRIANVRVNANGIPAGAGNVGNAQALVSFTGNNAATLTNSQLIVGYVQAGLNPSLRTGSNGGGLSGSGFQANQCSSNPGDVAILRYSANFPTAFKTRVVASPNAIPGGTSGQNPFTSQNYLGGLYSVSESGYIFNAVGGNGYPALPSLTGNGFTAGLADFGTRFKAVFSNIPAGVSINVSTVNVNNNTTPTNSTGGNPLTATAPAATSTSATYAQLIVSDTSPENGTTVPALTPTGFLNVGSSSNPPSGSGMPIVTFTPAAGTSTVTAVWEVVNSNTTLNQNFDFLVNVGYSSNVANNTPTAPSAITVSMSYAPISTTSSASSSANIPRFIDLGAGDNKTLVSINVCTTSLLFPFIVTVPGSLDTGVAISNTSMDPFGTGAQSGACTLYWYGNNNGNPTGPTVNTPVPNSTTGVVAAGTTWAGQASATTMAGATFEGYMIATCNFQYAHGYAAVTDIGIRSIMTSYLALVLQNSSTSRTGTSPKETLTH